MGEKQGALTVLALLLLAAGCIDTSPAFVPLCDADAPSRYEIRVAEDRMAATLYAFEERGWQNVKEARFNVAVGDCAAGTAEPVLYDFQGEEKAEEFANETMGVLATFFFATLFGSLAAQFAGRVYVGFGVATLVFIVGMWLGAVPSWAPFSLFAIAVLLFVYEIRGPRTDP